MLMLRILTHISPPHALRLTQALDEKEASLTDIVVSTITSICFKLKIQ